MIKWRQVYWFIIALGVAILLWLFLPSLPKARPLP